MSINELFFHNITDTKYIGHKYLTCPFSNLCTSVICFFNNFLVEFKKLPRKSKNLDNFKVLWLNFLLNIFQVVLKSK